MLSQVQKCLELTVITDWPTFCPPFQVTEEIHLFGVILSVNTMTNKIVFKHTCVCATTSVYVYSHLPESHHFTQNRLIKILQHIWEQSIWRFLFRMLSVFVQLPFSVRLWHTLETHDTSSLQH